MPGPAPQATPRRRGRFRRIAGAAAWLGLAGGVALAGGFLWFAAAVTRPAPAITDKADAIVVLTGGPDRIEDGIGLLAAGRAGRLLITGVNPDTTDEELARRHPGSGALLRCCVDLDRRARNTLGNAIETQTWVRGRGYRRVIVVTSSWHMPRTMLELGRALPDVVLMPHPVMPARLTGEHWWREEDMLRRLLGEYVKYVAALAGLSFGRGEALETSDQSGRTRRAPGRGPA